MNRALVDPVKNLKTVMATWDRFILTITIVFASALFSKAQEIVKIIESPEVAKMMENYIENNRSATHISGWRISVITTTDRRLMEQTKQRFQREFSMKLKWEYNEPYYYLKAGAFLTRTDALHSLDQIKKKFPTSFLSIDKITYEEL